MIIQVHVRVAYFGCVFETTETYPLRPEESLAPWVPNTGLTREPVPWALQPRETFRLEGVSRAQVLEKGRVTALRSPAPPPRPPRTRPF